MNIQEKRLHANKNTRPVAKTAQSGPNVTKQIVTVQGDKSAATAKTTQGEGEASLSERAGDSSTSHGTSQADTEPHDSSQSIPRAGLPPECLRVWRVGWAALPGELITAPAIRSPRH